MGLLMPGIFVAKFFCNFSFYKSFVQEGEFWRVLMPGIYVAKFFCSFSLYSTFVQEGEFWRVLMPGIYTVEVFAEGFTPREINFAVVEKNPTVLNITLTHVSPDL